MLYSLLIAHKPKKKSQNRRIWFGDHSPHHGFVVFQPLNTEIKGGYLHVLTGQWEHRGSLLVSVVLVYLLMFPSRTQKLWVSNDLRLCPSPVIVILNSKASKRPSYRPVKNGWFLLLLPLTACPNGGLPPGYCITVPPQRPAWPKTCGAAWLKISCGAFCYSPNNLFLWIWTGKLWLWKTIFFCEVLKMKKRRGSVLISTLNLNKGKWNKVSVFLLRCIWCIRMLSFHFLLWSPDMSSCLQIFATCLNQIDHKGPFMHLCLCLVFLRFGSQCLCVIHTLLTSSTLFPLQYPSLKMLFAWRLVSLCSGKEK